MSRIANQPVEIASGVTVTLDGQKLTLKGSKGEMSLNVHPTVTIVQEENGQQHDAGRDQGIRKETQAGRRWLPRRLARTRPESVTGIFASGALQGA